MTREEYRSRQEELLSMVLYHHNARLRIPDDIAQDLELFGVATVTMEGSIQKTDIRPEFETLYAQLNGEAEAADVANEVELHGKKVLN